MEWGRGRRTVIYSLPARDVYNQCINPKQCKDEKFVTEDLTISKYNCIVSHVYTNFNWYLFLKAQNVKYFYFFSFTKKSLKEEMQIQRSAGYFKFGHTEE